MSYLQELKSNCESICERIKEHHHRDWVANWMSFRCVSAESYINSEGEEGHRVYIEEADPNNMALKQYIWIKLQEVGFDDVEVITEW